ncbi:MAG: hypothetical protein ABI634_05455 [Acidobacteriota bacterium]
MAETKHAHADPVEGDGISYTGIFWFVVILVVTVLFCEVFVWALFKYGMSHRMSQAEQAPLAEPRTHPQIKDGRLDTGAVTPPTPGLNVQEPIVLKAFRDAEDSALHHYGWVDQGSQVVRLPIDRAKDLVIERGLPVRPAAPAVAAPAAAK